MSENSMTQSFGPEARGGSSSAQVILSAEPILYPCVAHPDVLVGMSQEAMPSGIRVYGVPATRLAEELGLKAHWRRLEG